VANQLLDLLQITDRSFPTGSFVHSLGLEWLVKHQPLSLDAVLSMRLKEQLGHFELVFLVNAYSMAPRDLDERFHAMVLPRESREASMQVGRQLLRNARDLFDDPQLHASADDMPYGHHPVAYGIVGKTVGLTPRTAAETYAFQAVRGQISAAQRLTRLGQVEAQRLLHRIKPAIDDAVDDALWYPIEEAAPFAPILDIAAMAHERSEVRLFVS
jgi:urease accessory protein